jgi:hypothetical protein
MARKSNKVILCISDTHAPFSHPDNLEFLKAIKKKYKPTRVIHVGDECDKMNLSFHDSDPDILFSPSSELEAASEWLRELEKIFPQMDLMHSNHGSLHLRKAKHAGISVKYIKNEIEIYELKGKGWKWHNNLILKLPNGQRCYFSHGMMGKADKVRDLMGMSVVQGHRHSEFFIDYRSNPEELLFAMSVGCSLDDKSLAFAYNKTTLKRPIIGHGIIIDGLPKLLPMPLNKRGRWDGTTP